MCIHPPREEETSKGWMTFTFPGQKLNPFFEIQFTNLADVVEQHRVVTSYPPLITVAHAKTDREIVRDWNILCYSVFPKVVQLPNLQSLRAIMVPGGQKSETEGNTNSASEDDSDDVDAKKGTKRPILRSNSESNPKELKKKQLSRKLDRDKKVQTDWTKSPSLQFIKKSRKPTFPSEESTIKFKLDDTPKMKREENPKSPIKNLKHKEKPKLETVASLPLVQQPPPSPIRTASLPLSASYRNRTSSSPLNQSIKVEPPPITKPRSITPTRIVPSVATARARPRVLDPNQKETTPPKLSTSVKSSPESMKKNNIPQRTPQLIKSTSPMPTTDSGLETDFGLGNWGAYESSARQTKSTQHSPVLPRHDINNTKSVPSTPPPEPHSTPIERKPLPRSLNRNRTVVEKKTNMSPNSISNPGGSGTTKPTQYIQIKPKVARFEPNPMRRSVSLNEVPVTLHNPI